MDTILIVASVLHVLSGVFWAGTTFALARLGGAHVDQFFRPQMGAAMIAVATGVWLWYLLHRGTPGLPEHVLGIGAIFAIAAAGAQGMMRRRGATGQRIAAVLLAVTVICMAAARFV
jgi:hypothetical protein